MGVTKIKNRVNEPVLNVGLSKDCKLVVIPEKDEVSIIDSYGDTVFHMKYDASVINNTKNGVAVAIKDFSFKSMILIMEK